MTRGAAPVRRHARHGRPGARHEDGAELPAAPEHLSRAQAAFGLQRSIGNQAVVALLQRYQETSDYSQGKAADGARANPFTVAEDHPSIQPRTTPNGPGVGVGFATDTPAKPKLNVADDGSLAINASGGEPREFYATPTVVNASNDRLDEVGSPIRLERGGHQLTPTSGGKALDMVVPKLEKKDLGQDEFVNLSTDTCRDVAAKIVGATFNYAKLGGKRQGGIDTGQPTVVKGTHEVAESLANGKSVAETQQAVGSSKSGAHPKVGKDYGTKLGGGELTEQARRLGVNQYADAEVGEAYVTQRIENQNESLKKDYSQGGKVQDFTWGYHYAAVVARSEGGTDSITLENYNRDFDLAEARRILLAELEQRFAKELSDELRKNPLVFDPPKLDEEERSKQAAAEDSKRKERIGEILHWLEHKTKATVDDAKKTYKAMDDEYLGKKFRMWYFRMVGKGKGQSFHEQMADSGYFSNPLTMAVGSLKSMSGHSVTFAKASAKVVDAQGRLPLMANMLNGDIARGYPRRYRVVGYGSGGGVGSQNRRTAKQTEIARKRANAVRDALVAHGAPPQAVVVEVGQPDPTWTDTQKRRADIVPEDAG